MCPALASPALGRNRALSNATAPAAPPPSSYTDMFHPIPPPAAFHPSITYDPSTVPPSGTSIFPTLDSLAAVLPPPPQTRAILDHAITHLSWYHGCLVEPQVRAECDEFFSHGRSGLERSHPAWLALLFTLLSAGVKHMRTDQLLGLGDRGLTEDEGRVLAKTYFDAAKACLDRANFLEAHELWAVQAIAVMVITLQDGGFSNLFPTLLTCGIAIAQSMGLHRLESDESWVASMDGQPSEVRVKSLIRREVGKRVFWALTAQDWFTVAFRRATTVQPTQITTPLPLNARDHELLAGQLVNHGPDYFSPASNGIIWVQLAKTIHDAFQHLDLAPEPSYSYVLQLDRAMQAILDRLPGYMKEGGSTEGMPPAAVEWIRATSAISSAHKVLTLHRPFLHRAFRDSRFESSRARALAASRTILRVGASAADNKLWTVPYHIAAGAAIVALDLFQRGSPKDVLDEEREEIRRAEGALRKMSAWSAIAQRGCALIENLLMEEAKLPEGDRGPSKKRRRTEGATPGGSAKRLSISSSAGSYPSPIGFGGGGGGGGRGARAVPSPNGYGHGAPAAAATPPDFGNYTLTPLDPGGGYGLGQAGALPDQFLSVFLTSGELPFCFPSKQTLVAGS